VFGIKLKVRALITINIVVLSLLAVGWNFGLIATKSANDSSSTLNQNSETRSNGDIYWSLIDVFSEPIFGQDISVEASVEPAIAIENGKIYVVWSSKNDTNGAGTDYDIFYRYFNGNVWSEIQVISEPVPGQDISTERSSYPHIAVENGKIYVVWNDQNNTNGCGNRFDPEIFFRCNLTGTSWEPIQVISEPVFGQNFNTAQCWAPNIAVENGKIYVVWDDENNTNGCGGGALDDEIFYRANLTGSSWEPIQVISEPVPGQDINTRSSYFPAISVENGKIYVVWMDRNDTNGAGDDDDIFYRANLTGSGWEPVQVISEPVFGQNSTISTTRGHSLAVKNGKIYVVWCDANDTNGAGTDEDIFYRCNLTGSNWEDIQALSEPVPGQDFNTADSCIPAIAVENSKIYVVWQDWNNTNGAGGDRDIFYRANLTGSSWEPVQVISEPVPGYDFNNKSSISSAITVENGKIYVVWQDWNNTNGAGTDVDIFYRFGCPGLFINQGRVKPISGNTSSDFNFTVNYNHLKNIAPTEITVDISGIVHSMLEVDPGDTNYKDGKKYYFTISHLDIGNHTFQCRASDGLENTYIPFVNNPIVYNTPPNIKTPNNLTAIEDTYYEIIYEYDDIDVVNVGQIVTWGFSTNASWLAFNDVNAMLYGTPTQDDIGEYWVNISINDTQDIDFTNFTLTVIDLNDNPVITTDDVTVTNEDELYEVDYNATDIDSPIENQIWT